MDLTTDPNLVISATSGNAHSPFFQAARLRAPWWVRFTLCVAALLHATLVSAEFSRDEKLQFVNQIAAINFLSSAAGEMMEHLETHPADAAAVWEIVGTLGGESSGARANHFQAMVWLADGNGDRNTSQGRRFLERASRREVIEKAFAAFDAAYADYVRVERDLHALRDLCTRRCENIDDSIGYLSQARRLYESFDKSLPYEEPRLDANLRNTASREMSPLANGRGDYRALLELLKSTDQLLHHAWNDNDSLVAGGQGYARMTALSGFNYMWMLWRLGWSLGLVVGAEHPAVAPRVDAITTELGVGASREQARMVLVEEMLGSIHPNENNALSEGQGLPIFFGAVCLDKSRALQRGAFSPAVRVIGKELEHLCDAWRFSNGGVWSVRFPIWGGAVLPPPAPTPPEPQPFPPESDPPVPPPGSEPVPTPPEPAPAPTPPEPEPAPSPPAGGEPSLYDLLAANLPSAGQFRLLPGSAIGDVLTQPEEFPFCEDIGCFSAHNAFLAWNGMAFDEAGGRWWNPAGGGHADYGGNEIYRFDFASLSWMRLTEPQPLTGPFMRDSDGDQVEDTCPAPATGPPATHTYDGTVFVPSLDEVLVLGTVPFCYGSMSHAPQAWVWSNRSSSWRKLDHFSETQYMRTAYDRVRDRVYLIGGAGQGTFYELDPQRNYAIVREGPYLGWTNWGAAEFDDTTRYLYYSAWDEGLYRLHIASDGQLGPSELVARWNSGEEMPLSLAVHSPSGSIVSWGGDGRVLRTNPDTGAVEDLTPQTGESPSRRNNVIYSKWVYVDLVDAFVGIDDAREGVWVYRLPDGGDTPPPQQPPAPSPSPGAGSFDERCNGPGVVFCDPLDTEGPWGVDALGNRRLMRNSNGTTGIPTTTWWRDWRGVQNDTAGTNGRVLPRLDSSVKASGTGSLKMDYPGQSSAGSGGIFTTNFSDDLSQQFGEGDTFYVQYRWRADCDFMYFDCDPASPTYKTARRYFAASGGGTTAFKTSIISTGDTELGGEFSTGACTWLEIVSFHGPDHTLQGYHSCGWYAGFDKPTDDYYFGSRQFDFQPDGDYTCWWMPDPSVDEKRSWGNTGPNCFYLESDEWITIQTMVRIGRWQPDAQGTPSSHVTVWAAREGEPQRVVIDRDLYLRGPENPGEKYGKVWLLPFMTGKDPNEDHPTGHIWYDELIVSREFVADPN